MYRSWKATYAAKGAVLSALPVLVPLLLPGNAAADSGRRHRPGAGRPGEHRVAPGRTELPLGGLQVGIRVVGPPKPYAGPGAAAPRGTTGVNGTATGINGPNGATSVNGTNNDVSTDVDSTGHAAPAHGGWAGQDDGVGFRGRHDASGGAGPALSGGPADDRNAPGHRGHAARRAPGRVTTGRTGPARRGRLPFTGPDTMIALAGVLALLAGAALLLSPRARRRLVAHGRRPNGSR